jgi:hypothetical protein
MQPDPGPWIAPPGEERRYRAWLQEALAQGSVSRRWVELACSQYESWLRASIAGGWLPGVHVPWAKRLLSRVEDLARKDGDRHMVMRLTVLTKMTPIMGQIAALAVERDPDLLKSRLVHDGTEIHEQIHGGFGPSESRPEPSVTSAPQL